MVVNQLRYMSVAEIGFLVDGVISWGLETLGVGVVVLGFTVGFSVDMEGCEVVSILLRSSD